MYCFGSSSSGLSDLFGNGGVVCGVVFFLGVVCGIVFEVVLGVVFVFEGGGEVSCKDAGAEVDVGGAVLAGKVYALAMGGDVDGGGEVVCLSCAVVRVFTATFCFLLREETFFRIVSIIRVGNFGRLVGLGVPFIIP